MDIVFCNADEGRKFFETDNVNECARQLSELCELGFLTDGSNGCFVTDKSGEFNMYRGSQSKPWTPSEPVMHLPVELFMELRTA